MSYRRFVDRLAESVDQDLAEHIVSSSKRAVFSHMRQFPWYRSIQHTLFQKVGIDDMIDEVASEMYLAVSAGETKEEAFATACRNVGKQWRKQYDWQDASEWSIQEAVEHYHEDEGVPLDPGAIYPELAVEDQHFDSAWGPKHVQAEKLLALMTPIQRETIIEYANARESQAEAGRQLGVGRAAVHSRLKHARKRAHDAVRDGIVEQVAVQL